MPELDSGLQMFATMLKNEGFRVYVLKSPSGRTLKFSRNVDGQECFGYVSNAFKSYEFYMPIKPSVENGSSMWVNGVNGDLTIANAKKVARKLNYNPLVGTQQNYFDTEWHFKLYEEI